MTTVESVVANIPSWMKKVTKAKDVKLPRSIMLYGLPGTRKTTIMASISGVEAIAKHGTKLPRILFIDIDQGTEVLAGKPEFADIDIVQISALSANAIPQLDAIIEDICTNDRGYDGVCFDSLDVGQDAIERQSELKNAHSTKAGERDGFAVYREIGEWTERTVRRLHECAFFVSLIAVHSTEKALESGAIRIQPRLSGSTKDTIGGIPSIVAYLEFKTIDGKRRLLASMGEQEDMITKNRFGLPDQIGDLTMPKLYAMMEAGLISEEKPKTKPATVAASSTEEK